MIPSSPKRELGLHDLAVRVAKLFFLDGIPQSIEGDMNFYCCKLLNILF